MSKKKIVILGGGFSGVYTALGLEKHFKPQEASITLVNSENYFVYKPLLPEVISGAVGLTDVVSPIRRLCPRTNLVLRDVENVDLEKQVVTCSRGFKARHLEIEYDYLVLALGAKTLFSIIPGLVEHGLPFGNLADAVALRNRVIRCLAEAEIETDPEAKKKLLTFVIAGGGFSGVEVAALVNDFTRDALKNYSNMSPQAIRVVLVQSGKRILPEVEEGLAVFAQDLLRKRGMEIILGDRLAAASSEKAIFKSGMEIPTRCVVSTVPSTVPDVLEKLDCEKERGRPLTTPHLELSGQEGKVWALGDCAWITLPNGDRVPPTAQHATREGACVADNIAAHAKGGTPRVFDFGGLGKMGSLGHHSAVAEVMGVKLSGFIAWVLWRFVYLSKFPGWDRRVRIGASWFMELLFPPDMVQLSLRSQLGVNEQHLEPGEDVFEEGDLGDSVYIIKDGTCEVTRGKGDSKEVLATLGAGQVFGEMALLADAGRNATVTAAERTNLLVITKPVFDALSSNVPEFGKIFSKVASQRTEENAEG